MRTLAIIYLLLLVNPDAAFTQAEPLERAQLGDYEVVVYPNPDTQTPGILKIFKKGETVFEQEGARYSLNDENVPKIGTDVTGDGVPDLVVTHYSGGAHCCFDISIFSLGEEFSLIQQIEAGHGFRGFEDLDGDKIPELLLLDWSFAYWNACFASSPAPEIVLRFTDGQYRIDRELMKKPLAAIAPVVHDDAMHQSDCQANNAWKTADYCLTSEVWTHMLDLIYAGHEPEAWRFLDETWGSDKASKYSFAEDFKQQLTISVYANGQ